MLGEVEEPTAAVCRIDTATPSAHLFDVERFYREFGARVRELRGTAVTQQELARRVGLSRASIANVERGAQRLPLHMIAVFADALSVSPQELLPTQFAAADPDLTPVMKLGITDEGLTALRLVLRKAARVGADGET
jgi:transcriptional regulator with XRE-family HTH domain